MQTQSCSGNARREREKKSGRKVVAIGNELALAVKKVNQLKGYARMKMTLQLAVQICGLLFCLCCFGADQIKASYLYKGFDTNGNLVVEGVLNFSVSATNRVQGDWKLNEVKPIKVRKLGPQIGSGKLEGQIRESKISLELNPGWDDNNVILNGQVTSTNMFGLWGYYGFPGKIVGGKFEAVKK